MSTDYKPDGYTSVAPYLVCDGVQRVIDFAKQAFGATELRRYETDEGRLMHAEIRVDDTVVMMGDSSEDWPPFPTYLHVYVDDAVDTYQRALDAGGEPVMEPTRKEGDPDKRGGVKDPSGNTWWISTQMGPE